jgi:hypothetical protein
MNFLLYLAVAILIAAWIIGFVEFNSQGIIHILLVISIIAIILGIIQEKNTIKTNK